VAQTGVSISLQLSFHVKLTQGSVFHLNHNWAPKFYFPASNDPAARHSVQEWIKIAEGYTRGNQLSKLSDDFGETFQTETFQPDSQ